MKLKYKNIGFVIKPHEKVKSFLLKSLKIIKELGAEYKLEKAAAEMIGENGGIDRSKISENSDLIVLIGGDGTFLSIAGSAAKNGIPVAGFNLGTLGFLTELDKDDLKNELTKLLYGKLKISERKMIRVKIGGQKFLALNDAVVTKGDIARIIKLNLKINDDNVTSLRADGLIISTPTGSTAYSLSAGGPIVDPVVNGIVITPICPHSLTLRPFVISDSSSVEVSIDDDSENVFITIDGQTVFPISGGGRFSIDIYEKKLMMVQSNALNYFTLLSDKLKWGL